MGALEIPEFVHAAGTFAGGDAPLPPIDPDGIAAQTGISGFTRNGTGNYTIELTTPLGFLEAQAEATPGLNQLVVIGAQIDPDTQRVQVRSYDTLGAPADCRVFNLKVLKLQVGPAGQLDIPPPPAPVSAGSACGPETFVALDSDDNVTVLAYETQYEITNPLFIPGENENTETELPPILFADKGRCIWVYTCYENDPNDTENFGRGQIKTSGADVMRMCGTGNLGDTVNQVDLVANNDSLKLFHDGIDTWYFGN